MLSGASSARIGAGPLKSNSKRWMPGIQVMPNCSLVGGNAKGSMLYADSTDVNGGLAPKSHVQAKDHSGLDIPAMCLHQNCDDV
jgi:hypothetical protein